VRLELLLLQRVMREWPSRGKRVIDCKNWAWDTAGVCLVVSTIHLEAILVRWVAGLDVLHIDTD